MTKWRPRVSASGHTLLELMIVLAILALFSVVTGLAFREPARRQDSTAGATIAAARRQAVRSGRSVTAVIRIDSGAIAVTAHADGSVVSDTGLGFDRLSGRAR